MKNKVEYILNKDPDYKQDSSLSSSAENLSKTIRDEGKNPQMRRARVEPVECLNKDDDEEKKMFSHQRYSKLVRKAAPNKQLMARLKKYKILTNNSFEWNYQEKS